MPLNNAETTSEKEYEKHMQRQGTENDNHRQEQKQTAKPRLGKTLKDDLCSLRWEKKKFWTD
jgi:hypothetical protein